MNRQVVFKGLLLSVFFFITHLHLRAQIKFEPGYIIQKDNEKITCLIRNVEWNKNPAVIYVKINKNDEVKKITSDDIIEFGVGNTLKYISYEVQIDEATSQVYNLGKGRYPDFVEKRLFLKALIEGSASLFVYEDNGSTFFFKDQSQQVPVQLIHKPYLTNENRIAYNNTYQSQLWNKLQCESIPDETFSNLPYKQEALNSLFISFNKCKNSAFKQFEPTKHNNAFHLTLRPGWNSSSLKAENDYEEVDFGPKSSFRIGVELGYVIPFNKNKWALIAEPTFQYYRAKRGIAQVDYKSIEIPLGVRYSLFLKNEDKIFLDAAYVAEFAFESALHFHPSGHKYKIEPNSTIAFSAGYQFTDRLSVMTKYFLSRDPLHRYITSSARYDTFSVSLGFKVF